eukprot:gnl/Chilomastix_caulleri/3546.p1 GENE.gnl/Chilomastix_caulleri/3546~~gnl/Chilomastix_caulleri/3546.p1  ORF type:complete len:103 (+),score=18.81 gnl/Chilomastix_caulleri/3546:245-553(+)
MVLVLVLLDCVEPIWVGERRYAMTRGSKIGSPLPDDVHSTPSRSELEEIVECTAKASIFSSLILRKACAIENSHNPRGFITTEVIKSIAGAYEAVGKDVKKK